VCIVTYNSQSTIGPLIRSLAADRVVSVIRIFDNASSDDTVHRVEELAKQLSVTITVHLSDLNLGFPAACNALFREAKSDVVAFVNPDIEFHDATLSQLVETVRQDHSVGIATCRLQTRDGRAQSAAARSTPTLMKLLAANSPRALRQLVSHRYRRTASNHLESDHDVDCMSGALMVLRTSLRNQVGYFDESVFMYLEDVDYARRVQCHGLRIRYVGTLSAWHDSGASAKDHATELYALMPQVWLTYFYRYGTPATRWFVRPVLIGLCLLLTMSKLGRRRRPTAEFRALHQAVIYRPQLRPWWTG
jgi:GT2 family glycosyltransferase